MGIFDSLGSKAPSRAQQQMDPRQMQQAMQQEIGQIKAHPGTYLKDKGFNIPDGMTEADTFNTPYGQLTNLPVTFSIAGGVDFSRDQTNDIVATITNLAPGQTFSGDTFSSGFAYSTSSTGSNLTKLVQGSQYKIDSNGLTLYNTWLKTLAPGVYYIYGQRIDDVPVKIGFINVNKGSYGDPGYAGTYIKPSTYADPYSVPPISYEDTRIADMNGFGVAAVSGSYTRVLGVNDYTISNGKTKITLDQRYLNSLEDGEYYIIGFPVESSTSEQAKICKFIVKSSKTGGTYQLTPDYQMWYGGTDPLSFYSEIHDIAGKDWNYKGYEWDVTVPDIIVSTRSNMSGATSVRIDQYWDLGYGYIMLGTNFLNSLNPEETYYMQVIDARAPDLVRSNVVSFRVGPTLRAIDTDKHVINSTRSLRFRSSSPVSEVYVGNIPLTDAADYGVSWDGKTVTLSFEFLNKRTPGNTYTIKVRTTDGNYASTTFQVLTTAQGSASPRTGDESNLGLWAAFLLLSGTAVVVLVPKLRKHDI